MKKTLLFSVLFAAAAFSASAQTDRTTAVAPATAQTDARPDNGMRQQHEQMMKDLNLTEAQQTQFKKINEDMRAKMEAIRNNSALSEDDRRTQMKSLREQQKSSVDAILTADQKAKWEAARQKMMAERKASGGKGNF